MFGINFNRVTGIDKAGKATMSTAKGEFSDIQGALDGTLAATSKPRRFDLEHAYLICGGDGLTYGVVDGNPSGPARTWYATYHGDDGPEYIIFSQAIEEAIRPCSETEEQDPYAGKTFSAVRVVDKKWTEYTGMILCDKQWTGPFIVPPVYRATAVKGTGTNELEQRMVAIAFFRSR
ncbi:Uu.00g122780.m01.CDS01 [Anthostomella pinea]|uniref:Uu.00g122780.m01.CDS01 n=1 Tax=Anthostomella pinea TaxID=933095 RepID=A0AAI8VIA5_9PEZI|nr:Uu.00g122780.m01.CDS01 [Anthostomella pinea]